MMNYNIAIVPGDGVGPEVTASAVKVLSSAGKKFGHTFHWTNVPAGGASIDKTGEPFPAASAAAAKAADAVLLGAVGGPKWDGLPGDKRPERALLGLRKALGVYANLRPARLFPQLKNACPLKDSAGFDLLIVRELIGGIYFGDHGRAADVESSSADYAVWDTERYARFEIERILRVGFECAMKRRGKLCLVDKANVLESSRFWREVAREMAGNYPDVRLSFLYVDNAAMQLIHNPGQFDVIVTSNLFGDILSDEAAALSGSIGMLSSASLGDVLQGRPYPPALYEPIHGSAPDIAGQNKANPLAAILSGAMMMRYSFGLETEASAIEAAVDETLDAGLRTADIASGAPGEKLTGTKEMGEAVCQRL
jgi:3-isopropylmalate dehydrogenase